VDLDILRPTSLDDALRLLAAHPGYWPLAGATDVMTELRRSATLPPGLVDLTRVGLKELRVDSAGSSGGRDGDLHLGAGVTATEIVAAAETTLSAWPLLPLAARRLGSPQIRSRATVGGNLGNASPCADLSCALLALDARVHLKTNRAERSLPLSEFFLGPGRSACADDELITHVTVPVPPAGQWCSYRKLGRRNAMVIAVASMAVRCVYDVRKKRIEQIAIAWGSVAPTTVRSRAVEAALTGQVLDDAALHAATQALERDIVPIDDQRATAAYRRVVCRDWLVAALAEVGAGVRQ
jgi:CO/xanthine dehydrogenase FAD-binding subunit